jgi:hypothetical protein
MRDLRSSCIAFLLVGIAALPLLGCPQVGGLDVRPVQVVPREASASRVPAYDALKRLAGEWVVVEEGKRTPAKLELAADGSALVQRTGFVAVFYPAGDRVAVSFFADEGYQERLRCDDKPAADGSLDLTFERIDATNVKPGSTPSPGFSLHVDADGAHMSQVWRSVDSAGTETKRALAFERAH